MSIQELMNRAVLALGFEERTGLNAFDGSLKANNGTLLKSNGVLPAWVAGKDGFGGALDFDGVGAYLEVADSASLTFGDGTSDEPFTVSVWIDADDITSFCPIGKGIYNTDAEWRLLISADDKVYFQTFDESVADCYIGRMYDTVLTGYEGTYIHIVGTYDGSGASTGFKIFVNGIRVDDTTYENEAGSYVAMENALNHAVWIARDAANYGNGKVDEVLVLPWELTEAEVRNLYESRNPFTATPNLRRGLVLDLDLQEGAGAMAFDRSWYRNNGTLPTAPATPTWVAGGGLDFDGVDDYVRVRDADSLDVEDEFTIMGWVYLLALVDETWASYMRKVAAVIWIQEQQTTKLMRTYQYGLTPPDLNFGEDADWFLGTWRHIAVTFVAGGNRVVYLDSGVDVSDTPTGNVDVGAGDIFIGSQDGTSEFGNIIVDEFRFYNRALSPAEIRAIYEGGR